MANEDAVNIMIRSLIRTALAMPADSVRPANQEAPTGLNSQQFATVLISSLVPLVDSAMGAVKRVINEVLPSTNISETVIVQYKAMVSVQFFKGDALDKARRLAVLLASSSMAESMQKLGIGLVSVSAVRDLTGLVDTLWELRGQLDIVFIILAKEILSVPTYNRFGLQISSDKTSTTISEVIVP
jgi:hypothetical protein